MNTHFFIALAVGVSLSVTAVGEEGRGHCARYMAEDGKYIQVDDCFYEGSSSSVLGSVSREKAPFYLQDLENRDEKFELNEESDCSALSKIEDLFRFKVGGSSIEYPRLSSWVVNPVRVCEEYKGMDSRFDITVAFGGSGMMGRACPTNHRNPNQYALFPIRNGSSCEDFIGSQRTIARPDAVSKGGVCIPTPQMDPVELCEKVRDVGPEEIVAFYDSKTRCLEEKEGYYSADALATIESDCDSGELAGMWAQLTDVSYLPYGRKYEVSRYCVKIQEGGKSCDMIKMFKGSYSSREQARADRIRENGDDQHLPLPLGTSFEK